MNAVNERQVGGTHYRSDYQHWDWVDHIGMGWHEACATKYVTRWRKKPEGVLGLEKAVHYIDKLIDNAEKHGRKNRSALNDQVIILVTTVYAGANDLNDTEKEICCLLASWRTLDHLGVARSAIYSLIDAAQSENDKIPF